MFHKGYIDFYIGVYENISDSGKKVPFPKVKVLIESKSENNTYAAFGFKQTNKIKDVWGRYDTHFMKYIRDEKEKVHAMHFNDVEDWQSFDLTYEDARKQKYKVLDDLFKFITEDIEERRKQREKAKLKRQQDRSSGKPPAFEKLEPLELKHLAEDFGIDTTTIDIETSEGTDKLIELLLEEYMKLKKGKE